MKTWFWSTVIRFTLFSATDAIWWNFLDNPCFTTFVLRALLRFIFDLVWWYSSLCRTGRYVILCARFPKSGHFLEFSKVRLFHPLCGGRIVYLCLLRKCLTLLQSFSIHFKHTVITYMCCHKTIRREGRMEYNEMNKINCLKRSFPSRVNFFQVDKKKSHGGFKKCLPKHVLLGFLRFRWLSQMDW